MASLDVRFKADGLRVIGLHCPEFDAERVPANVRREVGALGLTYPVVLDTDLKMWDALGNQYWPTVYLVDRKGRIRYVHVGETHVGSEEARDVEGRLSALLKEPA